MNTLKIEAQLKIEVPKNRSALFKMLSKRPKLSITKVVQGVRKKYMFGISLMISRKVTYMNYLDTHHKLCLW